MYEFNHNIMALHLIIFGPQGSGKGTQADILAEKYNLEHISTGVIFRQEMKSGSDLGQRLKKLLDSGSLVPDDMTNDIVEKRLEELKKKDKGFILDGYPRTIAQAEFIDKARIDHVFLLDISDNEAVDRLMYRFSNAELAKKRHDDADKDAIKRRLASYHRHTEPLVDFYKEKGIFHQINGSLTIPEVTAEIVKFID